MSTLLLLGSDLSQNLYKRQQLLYVIEAANWSVKWDGAYLTRALNQKKIISARTATIPLGVRQGIIHFGSFRTAYFRNTRYTLPRSCRKVLTVFHIPTGNPQYAVLAELQHEFDIIHTSCNATRQDLIGLGVAPEKITVIPLGVDLALFRGARSGERQKLRQRFGIPANAFVVGSFQKDGIGWESGAVPKLEKGPDILVETLAKAARQLPLHVLLVGPARGFVVQGLKKHNIPYTHLGYVADYTLLALFYRMLDAYLISARVEGGPKALLEAWASGIPVVTTRMGMAADVAQDGVSAVVNEVEDVAGLAQGLERIAADTDFRMRIVEQAGQQVAAFDWQVIAQQYYDQLYAKLL